MSFVLSLVARVLSSHLVESGHVLTLSSKDSVGGVIWAHLVLGLHSGACGEAELHHATVHVTSEHKGQGCQAHECDSEVSTLGGLYT